jgi:hypothetical protein
MSGSITPTRGRALRCAVLGVRYGVSGFQVEQAAAGSQGEEA